MEVGSRTFWNGLRLMQVTLNQNGSHNGKSSNVHLIQMGEMCFKN
jgi:hypothetical protein